ncbi:hypothetical protein PI93_013960 [Pandoraea fibrosis]|uniref:Uncharacterized protein n=1 Tax=Pandoraea fibrosis TaxID=1891094 RepID=A0ABX6HRT7_9BURK|nr:hypothetical protein [Pandoraea fibrosis]QHE92818.1 hypothetical protein PJ20_014040 [Pandoraea fibrosis]QHF13625.1 hypothetical protein PI93_013960 [Pandoraea fibrosis]
MLESDRPIVNHGLPTCRPADTAASLNWSHVMPSALAADLTQVRSAPRWAIAHVEEGALNLSSWRGSPEELGRQMKKFSTPIVSNALGPDRPQTPAKLQSLAAQAFWGPVESSVDVDRVALQTAILDNVTDGLTTSLVEGAMLALRKEFKPFRMKARPWVKVKSKVLTKPQKRSIRTKDKFQRMETAKKAVKHGKSCELVGKMCKLTGRQRNQLERYAVQHLGMPRVQKGESCKLVLMDLGVSASGSAKELLQAFAVEGPGVIRVANGEDWRTVYTSLGVDARKMERFPDSNFEFILRSNAAIRHGFDRMKNGEDGVAIAREFGFSPSSDVAYRLTSQERAQHWYADLMSLIEAPEEHYKEVAERLLKAFGNPPIDA